MSREIQPNVTNIFNDLPFVSRSQFQYEVPKETSLSFNKIREGISAILDFLLILDYRMDEGPQQKKESICIYLESIYVQI